MKVHRIIAIIEVENDNSITSVEVTNLHPTNNDIPLAVTNITTNGSANNIEQVYYSISKRRLAIADKLKKMGMDNIKDFVVLYDYDESLSIPSIKGWLEFLENKFVLHIDETTEDWDIPSESGVDIIDRVIFCVDKIMGLIQNA